jgi:predicted nucleic acid-binding protein
MLQCVLKPLHAKISPVQKQYLKQNKYNKVSMVIVLSSLISRREVNQFIIHNHISTLTAKTFLAGYNQSLDKIKEQQTIEIEEENMRAAEGI